MEAKSNISICTLLKLGNVLPRKPVGRIVSLNILRNPGHQTLLRSRLVINLGWGRLIDQFDASVAVGSIRQTQIGTREVFKLSPKARVGYPLGHCMKFGSFDPVLVPIRHSRPPNVV